MQPLQPGYGITACGYHNDVGGQIFYAGKVRWGWIDDRDRCRLVV